MLRSLREGGITKTLMGGVVILIIAAFAFDYRTQGVGSDDDDCVARLGGSCIELADYQTLLRLVAPSGATNKQLREMGFVQHAVDALVERELLLREAERLGVAVSEEELDELLSVGQVHFSWPADAPIPQALAAGRPFPKTGATPTVTYLRVRNSKTNAFDYSIYKRQVHNRLRMSPKAFKTAQEEEVIAARVRELITNPVRVSEAEVFSQFETESSSATARVVEAKTSWFRRFATQVPNSEVEKFLTEKQALVDDVWGSQEARFAGDCPVVSEILFRYPPGADDEAKGEVGAKAESALAMLKSGADFAVVAKVLSEASNAPAGGALGCLTSEYGPSGADLVAAVGRLSAGEHTPVLETPQGRHIFLLHGELSPDEAREFGRRSVARRLYTEEQAKEKAKAFAARVIEQAKAGRELDELAKELAKEAVVLPFEGEALENATTLALDDDEAPRMEVSRTFTLGGSPIFGVKDDINVAQEIFALQNPDDLLERPVETHTAFAVLQLKEKDVATKEEFDEQKADLLRAAREQKRAQVLTAYLKRLRDKAGEVKINQKHAGDEADDSSDPMESSG